MKLAALVGISNEDVARVAPIDEDGGKHASKELVQAVISMRLVKEQCEIEQIDDAGALGQRMHTVARNSVKVGNQRCTGVRSSSRLRQMHSQ